MWNHAASAAVMKTAWGKPVHVISFIRTLLIVLAVAVCLATLMGCGNSPEKDASPAAAASPAADASPAAEPIRPVRKQTEAATRTSRVSEL